ncbi:hypothetical protein [Telmatospirillum siberiense]|uniref:hypothetical protein n=1 Tax=Telmatospirillum siberiense TaxID=382514 RepID=UPI0013045845|nr:hypothetical protein [Telmatospirillum siberiense]
MEERKDPNRGQTGKDAEKEPPSPDERSAEMRNTGEAADRQPQYDAFMRVIRR